MKIAFFGIQAAFNHEHVGGTNSIVRRLVLHLKESGDDVVFVYYGCAEDKKYVLESGVEILKFRKFNDALQALGNRFEHVLSIYLLPFNRLAYAFFRKLQHKRIKFHHLYLGWNESFIKRQLLFGEARLFPFNGCLFCVSPRIYRYVSTWAQRTKLLLPPIPESYFLNPTQKRGADKISVTYCGRIDAGKGTLEVLELFNLLKNNKNVATRMCGFPWRHKPETMALHQRLLANPANCYEPIEYEHWTPQVDEALQNILQETDILLLPYRKLSSTVDTPLLLLEGMANLCAIISPALGDMHQIYGASKFNLPDRWRADAVMQLIENAAQYLPKERERIFMQNKTLNFDAPSVGKYFRESITNNG